MYASFKGPVRQVVALVFIFICFSFTSAVPAASTVQGLNESVSKAADYLAAGYGKGQMPSEWGMIALQASGRLGARDRQMFLQELKLRARRITVGSGATTDYARLALAVTALGGDPANHGGINLVESLISSRTASGKFADTVNGKGEELINAHIWAIIALHNSGKDIPRPEAARRWLLKNQNRDGGFGYRRGSPSDVDMTAQALIALACLDESPRSVVVRRAVAYIQKQQAANGGFKGWGGENCESTASVLQALTAWGLDPLARGWQKNGRTMISYLIQCQQRDGGFSHRLGENSNQIATEQALLALSDYKRGVCFYLASPQNCDGPKRYH